MKVYVITKGSYSDYHICAVTLDKEKADMFVQKFSDDYDTANIETYDTDKEEIILQYKHRYSCYWYTFKGVWVHQEDSFDYFETKDFRVTERISGVLKTCVLANTEEEAFKIASDRFAKYRAEKMRL